MSLIKNFLQNATPKAKALLLGGLLLFLAIIIISVINLVLTRRSEPIHVDISNFSESFDNLDLPETYQLQAQRLIWPYLKDVDSVNQSDPIPATIREGSIKKNDYNQYSFIVDVEPLRYSFKITFFWNPENQPYLEPGYTIECPSSDEIIYPDTPCPVGTAVDQIENYLPATIDFNDTSIEAKLINSMKGYYILAKVDTCDEDVQAAGNIFFRNWIKQLNFDPNDFTIVIARTCYN